MFSPFAYDPFFNTNSNRRRNRRLRGFIPIWEEFDNMTNELFNDPFFNDRIDNSNMLIENKEEQNANNNNNNNNTQVTTTKQSSDKTEEKGLVDSKNIKSNKGLLSLWNKDWKGLNEEVKLDIDEKEDKYIVSAKLNGFNKEHLKLEVKDGLLTVSGEMKEEKKDENSYSKSTRYVSRSIALPNNISEDKISAKWENGVLAVNIPKLDKPKEEKKDTIMIE